MAVSQWLEGCVVGDLVRHLELEASPVTRKLLHCKLAVGRSHWMSAFLHVAARSSVKLAPHFVP